jgi:hypothetical protein
MDGVTDVPSLAIAGVQIVTAVFLSVQGLKVLGVVDTSEKAARAAFASAFAFAFMALLVDLVPVTTPYVTALFLAYVGAIGAALGYFTLIEPLAERLGVRVSASDINDPE